MEILPARRLSELQTLGLATMTGDTIRYEPSGYADSLLDPEEQVRADLYLDLSTVYEYDPTAVEFERYHKIGHPDKKTDAKVDVRVRTPDGSPFILFELKSPSEYEGFLERSIKTQLYNLAAVENQRQRHAALPRLPHPLV